MNKKIITFLAVFTLLCSSIVYAELAAFPPTYSASGTELKDQWSYASEEWATTKVYNFFTSAGHVKWGKTAPNCDAECTPVCGTVEIWDYCSFEDHEVEDCHPKVKLFLEPDYSTLRVFDTPINGHETYFAGSYTLTFMAKQYQVTRNRRFEYGDEVIASGGYGTAHDSRTWTPNQQIIIKKFLVTGKKVKTFCSATTITETKEMREVDPNTGLEIPILECGKNSDCNTGEYCDMYDGDGATDYYADFANFRCVSCPTTNAKYSVQLDQGDGTELLGSICDLPENPESNQDACTDLGYDWTGNGGNLDCCGNDPGEGSPYETSESSCDDGQDNDCDGLTDCADTDCYGLVGPNGDECCNNPATDCATDDCVIESCGADNECEYNDRLQGATDECGECEECDIAGGNCVGLIDADDGKDCNDDCTYCYGGDCINRPAEATDECNACQECPAGGGDCVAVISGDGKNCLAPSYYCDNGECYTKRCDWNNEKCSTCDYDSQCFVSPSEGCIDTGENISYHLCDSGIWEEIHIKSNWDNSDEGYCTSATQCFVRDDYVDAETSRSCVNNGSFILDHFCEDGEWTSRTKLVALQLLELKGSSDDYTLFCDDYNNTLNYFDYYVAGITLARDYLEGLNYDLNPFGYYECDDSITSKKDFCINKMCVLVYNENNVKKVVFGTALNQDISEYKSLGTKDGRDVRNHPFRHLLPRDDVGECTNAIEQTQPSGIYGEYFDCTTDRKAWYNAKTQSVIYSNKEIALSPPADWWQSFLQFMKNPFRAVFNLIINVIQPEHPTGGPAEFNFIKLTKDFKKIYLLRDGVISIRGIIGSNVTAEPGQEEFLSVSYNCLPANTDICSAVDAYHEEHVKDEGEVISCDDAANPGSAYVQYLVSNTEKAEFGLRTWLDLTAKIRLLKGSTPPDSVPIAYISSPETGDTFTVGEPITFEGYAEGCNPNPDGTFDYKWDYRVGYDFPTQFSSEQNPPPLNPFTSDGEYTITLTVTDAVTDGDATPDSGSNSIIIKIEPQKLICSIVSNECSTGYTDVFHLSSETNAHAEKSTESNYPNKVCCTGIFGLTNACDDDTSEVILQLSSETNAHAELSGSYPNNVCLSAPGLVCEAYPTCPADYTCVATISADTNAHVASCDNNPYDTKICCGIPQTD